MSIRSNTIADVVEAIADRIAAEGAIKFGEIAGFLFNLGIDTAGDEELTGEHVNQPHVSPCTTLCDNVSGDYLSIVAALFKHHPVMLKIGDRALFASHEEPWFLAWADIPRCEERKKEEASPCAIADAVDTAARFIEERGAISFAELANFLAAIGIETDGDEVLPAGDHPVGLGRNDYRWYNTRPEVTLCAGSTEFVAVADALLSTKSVALEITTLGPTAGGTLPVLLAWAGDTQRRPGHYHVLNVRDPGGPEQLAKCWEAKTNLTFAQQYLDEVYLPDLDKGRIPDDGWDAIWIVGCGPRRCRRGEICDLPVEEWGEPHMERHRSLHATKADRGRE